jgi:1-deoxy-D-xylulose-5-phosphate synthase
VAIFALGALVPLGQEIAAKLEGMGVSSAVINARFTKPVDVAMLEFYARSVDVIVTLEDHVLRGGFGSAVLEELNNLGLSTPVVRIGWPDQFIEHGKPDALRAKYGISVDAVLDKLKSFVGSTTVSPQQMNQTRITVGQTSIQRTSDKDLP